MIRMTSLGGINEHGRNCFCLKGSKTLLLDCGEGEKGEEPDFEKTDIKKIDYLFLSHCHIDHTGSIQRLLERGFHGTICLSKATLSYLKLTYPKIQILMPNEEIRFSEGLRVSSTRSGHCFGSLSLHIRLDGKKILYTGDYLEESVFSCDRIRKEEADLAIIDAAYDDAEKSYSENKKSFLDFINGKTDILLPLPKNGRSMDVISFLNEERIPYHLLDSFFMEEKGMYLKKDIPIRDDGTAKVRLFSDPQIKKKENLEYISQHPESCLIFTGTLDSGSMAEKLLKERKNTFFFRINVHQRIQDAKRLEEENTFRNVILFHNRNTKEKTEILL